MWFRRKPKVLTERVESVKATKGSLIATKCGHPTERKGTVTAFGQSTVTEMPINDGKVEFCLACIGDMAIRCAWCGDVIFIGDPVTLYIPKRGFDRPDYAVEYGKKALVGCLGWNCAETGGDRSGFWVPGEDGKGSVLRVLSPLEQMMRGGKSVIVSDVGDMSEALQIRD